MKNILVLEDNSTESFRLNDIITKYFQNCNITICSSEAEARDKAGLGDYHIFIVSVMLHLGSGLDFARWLRTIPKYQQAWLILLSDGKDFLHDAIRQTHCYDFLLKPYSEADVIGALENVVRSTVVRDTISNYLTVLSKGSSYKIKFSNILFIEINNKNMDIHTSAKVYSVKRYPLSKIKEQLPPNQFQQCHRSYIVNVDKVSVIESKNRDTFLLMDSHDRPIPVGIRYKDLFASENIME